jgi:hypothetical protein
MEQQEKKGPTDAEVNAKVDALLKEFHRLWDNSPKDIEKFESFKQRAKLATLYPRQMDAIIARCNNVINGTYGNTKKPEHYEQSKSSK